MADYPEFIPDFYEEYEFETDPYPEDFFTLERVESSLAIDPVLVGGVTLVTILLLIGFLFRSWETVFGSSLKTDIADENSQTVISNDQFLLENNTSSDTDSSKVSETQCGVSAQFPSKITRWCDLITHYAKKHNLDPDLVAALVWLESGGNELAYSRSGAVGLMQIMPRDGLAASFMCVNGPCFRDRPSTEELQDPEYNIAFGTRFLASLIRRNGNLRDALKSYGPMDAGYSYSDKVLSIFNRYKGN
jgi:hypothetical protein